MTIAMKIVWDRLEIAYAIGKKPGVIRKALGMMLDIQTSSIVKMTWLYETSAKDRKQWSVNIRVLCVADDRERASAKHERCGELAFFYFWASLQCSDKIGSFDWDGATYYMAQYSHCSIKHIKGLVVVWEVRTAFLHP